MNQKDQIRRQLRAYMVTNAAELDSDFNNGISIWFTVRNAGQTPAYHLEIRKCIVFWPKDYVDMAPPDDDEMMLMDPVILGPGDGIKTSMSERLSVSKLKKIENGELICLVFGICTYWDIFDNTMRMEFGDDLPEGEKKEWFTRFAWELVGYGTDRVRVTPFSTGNFAN